MLRARGLPHRRHHLAGGCDAELLEHAAASAAALARMSASCLSRGSLPSAGSSGSMIAATGVPFTGRSPAISIAVMVE